MSVYRHPHTFAERRAALALRADMAAGEMGIVTIRFSRRVGRDGKGLPSERDNPRRDSRDRSWKRYRLSHYK